MNLKKPLNPVKPEGMEIIYYYPCPYCSHKVPVLAPGHPSMAQCDTCRQKFPVVPADIYSLRFLKTILDDGRAGVNPDFI